MLNKSSFNHKNRPKVLYFWKTCKKKKLEDFSQNPFCLCQICRFFNLFVFKKLHPRYLHMSWGVKTYCWIAWSWEWIGLRRKKERWKIRTNCWGPSCRNWRKSWKAKYLSKKNRWVGKPLVYYFVDSFDGFLFMSREIIYVV